MDLFGPCEVIRGGVTLHHCLGFDEYSIGWGSQPGSFRQMFTRSETEIYTEGLFRQAPVVVWFLGIHDIEIMEKLSTPDFKFNLTVTKKRYIVGF